MASPSRQPNPPCKPVVFNPQIEGENHRKHRNLQRTQKFPLCVSGRGDASPLLCASALYFLGALCALGALGVPIHRLTQIYTDWMIEIADFADSAEKIWVNLCNLWFSSLAPFVPLAPLALTSALTRVIRGFP